MSKATYWQRGEAIDYKNTSSTTAIEANTIIVLGKRVGVAGTSIAPLETGSVHIMGVFIMPKKIATSASEVITIGQTLYWDPEANVDDNNVAQGGITAIAAPGLAVAGIAIEASADTATEILVALCAAGDPAQYAVDIAALQAALVSKTQIDYTNPSSSTAIAVGTVVSLATRCGIAEKTIAKSATGKLTVEGVFELPKTTSLVIDLGDAVYWNTSTSKVTKTNTDVALGWAVAGAAVDADTVKVKLLG